MGFSPYKILETLVYIWTKEPYFNYVLSSYMVINTFSHLKIDLLFIQRIVKQNFRTLIVDKPIIKCKSENNILKPSKSFFLT